MAKGDEQAEQGAADAPAAAPAEEDIPVLPEEEARELAKYDLTSKMAPFLERHFLFKMFPNLLYMGMYRKEDLARAELKILAETNMIDFAVEKYAKLGEEPPESLNDARRVQVLELLESNREKVLPLLHVLEDDEKVRRISALKSVTDICAEFEITPDVIEGLVQYAKLQFECGNYSLSGELLKHYRNLVSQDSERPTTSRQVSCLWGSLATFILSDLWEEASESIFKIDGYLEDAKLTRREVLVQRTWLLHWTLFVIFLSPKVETKLLDFFLNEKSLSIISLACPHLFRYVSACLILQKRLKHLLKDTVWIIRHEASVYSDPVTRFLLALYIDMDFDEAQGELQLCEKVCKADYFLHGHWAEFQENARLLIFESYCRIHQCINIGMIASKLNMSPEEAELWIVKLIQSAKLDARIDSEKSRVIMSKAPPSPYQQVIEKTKNLAFRSTMLLSNLEKRER